MCRRAFALSARRGGIHDELGALARLGTDARVERDAVGAHEPEHVTARRHGMSKERRGSNRSSIEEDPSPRMSIHAHPRAQRIRREAILLGARRRVHGRIEFPALPLLGEKNELELPKLGLFEDDFFRAFHSELGVDELNAVLAGWQWMSEERSRPYRDLVDEDLGPWMGHDREETRVWRWADDAVAGGAAAAFDTDASVGDAQAGIDATAAAASRVT